MKVTKRGRNSKHSSAVTVTNYKQVQALQEQYDKPGGVNDPNWLSHFEKRDALDDIMSGLYPAKGE